MGLLDGFKGILADYTPNLLPEDPDKNAAARQALMMAGGAMLSGKGNFWEMAGQGLLAGGEGYQGALAQAQQDRLRKAQQERWDLENEQNKAALERKMEEDGIIAGMGGPGSISGAAGVSPTSSGVQSPAGSAPTPGARPAGGYSTTYNGTPYSGPEAQAAAEALGRAGASNFSPEQGNQVMALARQGMTADQAAQVVLGGGAAPAPRSAAVFGPPPELPRIGQPRRPPPVDSSLEGAPGAPDGVDGAGRLPSTFNPGSPPAPALPSLDELPKKGQAGPVNFARQAYERNLAIANRLLENKHVERANEYFAKAEKFAPEVRDTIPMQTLDGRRVMVNRFKDGSLEEVTDYVPEAPKLTYQDIGNETLGLDPTGKPVVRFKNGARPGSRSSGGAGGGEMGGVVSSPFSPEAIENAAARYNLDGTLPPMGMGKSGVQVRAAILNRAAVLASGVDPEEQRRQQLNNKGEIGARNSAVRSFSTGKDGQAVQSANTALNHLVTVRQLAEAQRSGDARAWNKAARAFGTQFGVAEPTNLNAALIMVAPEISKAVVGAGGTGHERDQALKALDPNGSPDQIIGATHTMEELFGGRLTEAKRTYERTTKLTDFDTSMLSPAARAVLARAQEHGAPNQEAGPGGKPRVKGIGELPLKPPAVGTVDRGHRFKGGNPADPKNWEKVR